MNPFAIPIAGLPASPHPGPRIPAAELERLLAAADVVAAARREAAEVQASARARIAEAENEAAAIIGRAEEEAAAIAQRAADAAVAQAVNWLVAEQDIERSVARAMADRLRRAAADWLAAAGCADEAGSALAERLARHMPGLLGRGALTLTVAPEQLGAMRAAFAADERVELKSDASLGLTEAWLDTPQLRLCFDLERQWQEVLRALRQELAS
ncbi:hypothetical protein [Paludibacterium yongneupense]|uniref:hypothetical protein n=1 Tax=Paludibacterium yongneupense TaxID=400061 RepID=UPI0003F9B829|nr:hypothetical protein [Paludibacterium yongneupense]